MTPAERLRRDLALLNRLDSAEFLAETALGEETTQDRGYRVALEKLAR